MICRTAVLVVPLLVGSLSAQNAPRSRSAQRVTVSGVAFDSLHNVPLANAFITIAEASRSATSDAKGRFSFDSLTPGTYTFAMQHEVFDSLGLSGAQSRIEVTDGRVPVALSVPSFATLWTAACGALPVPAADTGLVYGAVRDAKSQAPMAEAWIELSWIDLVSDNKKDLAGVTQRRWKSETQSDRRGGYAVCGVPIQTTYRLKASYLKNATGSIELAARRDRVRRRDLVVPGTASADSALRGAVSGLVLDGTGKPVTEVRVILDSVTEVRTDKDGRFMVANAPTGTRQMEFSAIGMAPVMQTVDILSGDTTFVNASLQKVTNLDALNVTASATRMRTAFLFDERRKQGFGAFMDSSTVGKRGTMAAAFAGFAGVTVQSVRANGRLFNLYLPSTGLGQCLAMLMVDGIQQFDHEILGSLYPSDIAGVEVYAQRTTVPTELMRTDQKCGVIAVWTKRAFNRP